MAEKTKEQSKVLGYFLILTSGLLLALVMEATSLLGSIAIAATLISYMMHIFGLLLVVLPTAWFVFSKHVQKPIANN